MGAEIYPQYLQVRDRLRISPLMGVPYRVKHSVTARYPLSRLQSITSEVLHWGDNIIINIF